jgi:hypothetical protein
MRSLNPVRLASQANVELLDDEDVLDEELDAAIIAGEFDYPPPDDENHPLDYDNDKEASQVLPIRSRTQFPSQPVSWNRLPSSQ